MNEYTTVQEAAPNLTGRVRQLDTDRLVAEERRLCKQVCLLQLRRRMLKKEIWRRRGHAGRPS